MGRSIDSIGRGAGFVHKLIAILINTVTSLRGRADRTEAGDASLTVAELDSRLTRRIVTWSGVERHIIRQIAHGASGDTVIGHRVTIIIEAIADLGLRGNVVLTVEHAR